MLKLLGLVHFTIPVSDLERSTKFYHELLGMPVVRKSPHITFLRCGNDYVNLAVTTARIQPNAEGETRVHHAFRVATEGFDESMDVLKENGVKILLIEERQDGNFRGRSLYFHDPDGNALEIHDAQEVVEEFTPPIEEAAMISS